VGPKLQLELQCAVLQRGQLTTLKIKIIISKLDTISALSAEV